MFKLEVRIIVGVFDFDTDVDIYTIEEFKKYLSKNYDINSTIYADSINSVIDDDIWELDSNAIYERITDDCVFNKIMDNIIEAAKGTEYVIMKETCVISDDRVFLPEKVIYRIANSI